MVARSIRVELESALDLLRQGDLRQAHQDLQDLLQKELDNRDVLYALTGIRFWEDRMQRVHTISGGLSQGEYLVGQWGAFVAYMQKRGGVVEPVMYALRCCVFTYALRFYGSLITGDAREHPAEVYRKTGLCYKALGNYDAARECLEFAVSLEPDSSAILAELADAYALAGDERWSKLYFREALFKGASKLELNLLESDLIFSLIERVKSYGFSGVELLEWLPVYGTLEGVLTAKRELRAVEIGKLKQAIYSLENDLRNEKVSAERRLLRPRLINHFFWLVDHYVNVQEDKRNIDEVLLKIKLLDEAVYHRYVRIA